MMENVPRRFGSSITVKFIEEASLGVAAPKNAPPAVAVRVI
jgi:hypothetical protein